jgi:ketosteroid isomerase-like protein
MSQGNVELVRRLNPSGVDLVQGEGLPDAIAEGVEEGVFADDLEVRFVSGVPGAGAQEAHGADGLLSMWREWLLPWASYRIDTEDIIDAGDEVVVFGRVEARTARDGVLMRHAPAAVWSIRNGKVASIRFYLDRGEALEAVGLSEQDAHADT